MSDFEDRIKFLMTDRLEKCVAEEYHISEESARDTIKKIGFAAYVQLLEASADFGNQSSNTGSTVGTKPVSDKPGIENPFNPDGTLNTSRDTIGAEGQIDLDGAIHDIVVGKRFGNDAEVTTAKGQKMRVPVKNIKSRTKGKSKTGFSTIGKAIGLAATAKNKFMTGFNKGQQLMSSEDHDELHRLRELAGIEETCSAGATGAGAIATAPSVVGNTAHTPTDKLRARLRRKKEKKN